LVAALSSVVTDSQLAHTVVNIEAAHSAVDTVAGHMVVDIVVAHTAAGTVIVNTAEAESMALAADTDPLAYSWAVALGWPPLRSDFHNLYRSAYPAHSAYHNWRRIRKRRSPFVEPWHAYSVHNGHRKRFPREPARGRRDRGVLPAGALSV
jgi:hypothetical protein